MAIGNRKGRFWIYGPRNDSEFDLWYSNARAVLRDVVVTRAEYLYHEARFEYIGISPHFDEIEQGERLPEYIPIMKTSPKTGESDLVAFERTG